MPKKRAKPGSRQIQNKIFIVCEGKKNKSEYSYLDSFIKACAIPGNLVEIILKDVTKNTGKELVKEIWKIRKEEGYSNDIAWVVYDKDGYTKHPETFDLAQNKNVNIAFSSVSFEIWILLHFEYTTRQFEKSDDVIDYLKSKNYIIYEKKQEDVYNKTKKKIEIAISNAQRLRNYHNKCALQNSKIYELNPYSNLDELICQIQQYSQSLQNN